MKKFDAIGYAGPVGWVDNLILFKRIDYYDYPDKNGNIHKFSRLVYCLHPSSSTVKKIGERTFPILIKKSKSEATPFYQKEEKPIRSNFLQFFGNFEFPSCFRPLREVPVSEYYSLSEYALVDFFSQTKSSLFKKIVRYRDRDNAFTVQRIDFPFNLDDNFLLGMQEIFDINYWDSNSKYGTYEGLESGFYTKVEYENDVYERPHSWTIIEDGNAVENMVKQLNLNAKEEM